MFFTPTNPYYSFSQYLQQRYGEKVRKISIDAGFSCPNRDGNKGRDGCIYCRVDSFSRMDSLRGVGVAAQVKKGIAGSREKMGIQKFIAYFQASTNTYAPAALLRELYESAVSFPEVIGLSISTRPDCLSDEVLDLIQEFSRRLDVWVELGLQSTHDETLQRLNRGHTFADYLQAVEKLKPLKVRVCTHIILGLPGEDVRQMQQTASSIARLPIEEVKLHPLLVLKDTLLEKMYHAKCFAALGLREYAELACDFIERMPPRMVIQRLTAEAPSQMLIAPEWVIEKHVVRREIGQEFIRRQSCQGKRFIKKLPRSGP